MGMRGEFKVPAPGRGGVIESPVAFPSMETKEEEGREQKIRGRLGRVEATRAAICDLEFLQTRGVSESVWGLATYSTQGSGRKTKTISAPSCEWPRQ